MAVLSLPLLYDAELNCPREWDLPARSVGLARYVADGTGDIPGLYSHGDELSPF